MSKNRKKLYKYLFILCWFPSILKYTYYFIVRIGKRTLRKIWPKDLLKLIEPFKVMLSRGKTISDEIIDFAGKRDLKEATKASQTA